MPIGAAVHLVTGSKFAATTFNAATSTFTLASSRNLTSTFAPNYILTVLGTSTANDGYYQILSSTFTGGHTVVTVQSYSTGTAYPGTVPFVSSGTGTVILFNVTGAGPAGLNWTSRTSPTIFSVAGLAANSGTTLLVDYYGNTYKSTNGGHTWSTVGSVTDAAAGAGGVLAEAGTTWIYSSTAVNVARSTNNGTSWSTISTGIASDAGNSTIATNGSGTWVVSNNILGSYTIEGTLLGTITGSVTSGTFTASESLTQAVTGAIVGNVIGTVAPGGPIYLDGADIFSPGTPDATDIWTGNTSGATFTPTAVPTYTGFAAETITQAVTGATALTYEAGRGELTLQGISITGSPDNSNWWTGGLTGATFAPSTVPTANYTAPMAYSTNDGVSWTPFDPFDGGIPDLVPFIWNGTEFATFIQTGINQYLATSTDGISWSITQVTSDAIALAPLAQFGSNYIAGDSGQSAIVLSSTVGGLATTNVTDLTIGTIQTVVANSSLVFAFDTLGNVENSSNGITFVQGTLNFDQSLITASSVNLNAISLGLSSNLVAVGGAGVTFSSTNGTTWTYHASGQTNNLLGVASGLSHVVAVGGTSFNVSPTGTLLTSTNNTTWIANNQGSTPLLGVAFLNSSTFVTVGQGGNILASTTPAGSWSTQTSGTSFDLYSVCGESSSSSFIVGDQGTILHSTSTPGTSMTWTPQTIGRYRVDGFVTSSISGSVTSGVFDFADTVTQAVTGATAQVFSDNFPYVPAAGPLIVVTSTITGTPNATDIWTQTATGATFTPTSLPTPTASFTSGETVTQANTGATATLIGTIPGNGPMIIDATSVVGFPDSYSVWIGGTSGAQFSPNMLTLTQFPSATNLLFAVASHGGTTVAVGVNATIVTTTDSGATWTSQVIDSAGGPFNFVVYDTTNSLFVSGFEGSGQLVTSPDGISWAVTPTNNVTANGAYNNSAAIGSAAVIFVGQGIDNTFTANILTTTDESTFVPYTAGGTFTSGETITQVVSGATATLIAAAPPAVFYSYGLVVNSNTITGTPDTFNAWVGNTSGAIAFALATPSVDSAYRATYDSTNNSFIAGGFNGSISTYP